MTPDNAAVVAGTAATTVNASIDGDEPLGEAPELTIDRAVGLIDRQASAITAIHNLHFPVPQYECPDVCVRCRKSNGDMVVYPCSTIRVLQEHGL